MTISTTFSFLSLSIPLLFKLKQTCRLAIVKQVCLLVNDNEQKVEHHQIQLDMKQMLDTIKFPPKHPKNALEVQEVIHRQNRAFQINKAPRPKNHRHQIEKGLRKGRNLSRQSLMPRVHKHHHPTMTKDKIYLLVVYPWFQQKYSIVCIIFISLFTN